MKKLGPGVYTDGDALHFDAPGICEHFGVPFNARNWATLKSAIVHVVTRAGSASYRCKRDLHDSD